MLFLCAIKQGSVKQRRALTSEVGLVKEHLLDVAVNWLCLRWLVEEHMEYGDRWRSCKLAQGNPGRSYLKPRSISFYRLGICL